MPSLLIKGRPAEANAAKARGDELDDVALMTWGGAVLDLFDALSAYLPLRDRWTRMEAWLSADRSDPRWPERARQCASVWTRCLGPGGLFDQVDRVLQRLEFARRQLSETAVATLIADYGIGFETEEHPFWTNVFLDHAPSDLTELLDAWAIATGGHAKRKEMGPCPF